MISVNFKVNLRWFLRPYCWWSGLMGPYWPVDDGHRWQDVVAGDAFSWSYHYCRRCGLDWRRQGLRRCWFPSQHRWLWWGEGSDDVMVRCLRCHETALLKKTESMPPISGRPREVANRG